MMIEEVRMGLTKPPSSVDETLKPVGYLPTYASGQVTNNKHAGTFCTTSYSIQRIADLPGKCPIHRADNFEKKHDFTL